MTKVMYAYNMLILYKNSFYIYNPTLINLKEHISCRIMTVSNEPDCGDAFCDLISKGEESGL